MPLKELQTWAQVEQNCCSFLKIDSQVVEADKAAVIKTYQNQVLLNVNRDCLRLAIFEGEYHWHQHPDSDELFLVVAGTLQVDFAAGRLATLTEL